MRATVFVIAGLMPTAAFADPSVTLSLGANSSRADAPAVPASPPDFNLPSPWTNLPLDDFGGYGVRARVGVAWSDTRAIEIGWSRFGSVDGAFVYPGAISPCAPICPGPIPNPPPGPPVVVPAEHQGWSAWAAYTPSWRYGPLQLSGKLGIARIERKTEVQDDPWASRTERDVEILLGAGATHWFTDRFGITLDAEVFGDNAMQLGISASFRW